MGIFVQQYFSMKYRTIVVLFYFILYFYIFQWGIVPFTFFIEYQFKIFFNEVF